MSKPAETDRPIHPLIRERWSPRAFADTVVERDTVLVLLDAARWAASAFNEQPWRYVIGNRLNPVAHDTLLSCLMPANQAWARKAPVLMLAVAKSTLTMNNSPNRHAFHDVGQANAHIALQAVALGLAVHQMAGFDSNKARAVLHIPAGFEPVAMLAVGYPGAPDDLPPELLARETAPRQRKALGEIAFAGQWGIATQTQSPADPAPPAAK